FISGEATRPILLWGIARFRHRHGYRTQTAAVSYHRPEIVLIGLRRSINRIPREPSRFKQPPIRWRHQARSGARILPTVLQNNVVRRRRRETSVADGHLR